VRELLQNAATLFNKATEMDPKSADSIRNLAATYAKFSRLCTEPNKRGLLKEFKVHSFNSTNNLLDDYYAQCYDSYKRAYELDKNNRDLMVS